MKYHDISPIISSRTAVFPGDLAFQRKIALDFKTGGNLLLSNIHSTLHIGAHVDAPSHYHAKGGAIADRDLSYYIGECQVIEISLPRGVRILPSHLAGKTITAARVLFKTGSFPNPDSWNNDFNSFSPELVDMLAQKGVRLLGIDTPSIDPWDDAELLAHQAVFRHDLANLEGIVLQGVPEGIYTLIALPLRIEDADASPVRAVLLEGLDPRV